MQKNEEEEEKAPSTTELTYSAARRAFAANSDAMANKETDSRQARWSVKVEQLQAPMCAPFGEVVSPWQHGECTPLPEFASNTLRRVRDGERVRVQAGVAPLSMNAEVKPYVPARKDLTFSSSRVNKL